MKRIALIAALMLGCVAQAQVVDTSKVYQQELKNQQEAQRREAEAKQQERERYEAQRQADMAQAEAEREARAEAKAAKRQARKEWYKEIGRRPRLLLDVPVGLGSNTKLLSMADEHHGYCYDLGISALWTHPIARRWDLQAGLGVQYRSFNFANSVRYDATTQTMVPQTLDGWRNFSSSTMRVDLMVPLHITHVSKRLNEVYLGLNVGYNLLNAFVYSRVDANGQLAPNDTLSERNLKALNPWRLEVAVGFGKRIGIMTDGVELYLNLLPSWRSGDAMHEFGIRISL